MNATRRNFLTLTAAGVVATGFETSHADTMKELPDGSTIVLVRHADKMDGSKKDVPLSPKGEIRAQDLRDVLMGANLSAIVTSNFLRSTQTAAPLAAKLILQPIEIPRDANEKSAVEEAVRSQLPGAVLVVGHSETVPAYVKAFGVNRDVQADTFDNMFIIIRSNGQIHFIHGRYGAASS